MALLATRPRLPSQATTAATSHATSLLGKCSTKLPAGQQQDTPLSIPKLQPRHPPCVWEFFPKVVWTTLET
ncbi:hypothetical protein U9M48_011659 [Paspalum notatum var. saurae]|uniref:Uncharacterized protein n=1 Tax=Paspalum notatum var. saurae TaxID=547442 RepID=A0AAQ3SWS1_PASNO